MTATLRPAPAHADDRIANLFIAGHGLDYVSERGVASGWTRADAIRVASTRGWSLDADGRIPGAGRPTPPTGLPAVRPTPAATATAASDPRQLPVPDLIARGQRHRTAAVRRAADRAQGHIEKLRQALVDQIEADRAAVVRDREVQAARQELERLEAEARRLRSVITGRTASKKPATAGRYAPCKRCGAPNGGRGVPNHRDVCRADG